MVFLYYLVFAAGLLIVTETEATPGVDWLRMLGFGLLGFWASWTWGRGRD